MIELEYQPCQWPSCPLEGKNFISYQYESIWVCQAHKGAVMVNIERSNKIWTFKLDEKKKKESEEDTRRPGRERAVNIKAPPKKVVKADDWEQEAAKRADSAAIPVDPCDAMVQPRRREIADDTLSRLFGPKDQC